MRDSVICTCMLHVTKIRLKSAQAYIPRVSYIKKWNGYKKY